MAKRRIVKGKLTKGEIREKIRRQPDVQAAQLSEDEIEEMVDDFYVQQEDFFDEYLTGAINQELMRMAARGEVYWDPAGDAWKMADK